MEDLLKEYDDNETVDYGHKLRYQLYLDCMEVSDLPKLDNEQITKILHRIMRKPRLSANKIAILVDDIQLDYQRNMCNFALQAVMKKETNQLMIQHQITPNDYEAHEKYSLFKCKVLRKKFHWDTLYVLPEVYDAVKHIIECCDMISGMSLFTSTRGKSLNLHDFIALQEEASARTIRYLEIDWVKRVVHTVRMCLRDIGKGSFDINQRNPHIYDMIKLKRLISLKVTIMQSALINLVERSLKEYLHMLEVPALTTANFEPDFKWGNNLHDTQFPSPQIIFNLELIMSKNGACYTTNLKEFQTNILSLLDNGVRRCHQIPQVQIFLLPKLKFSPTLTLSSIGLLDERVCRVRDRLTACYEKSIIPLQAYALEFNKYTELFTLNVEEYIQQIKEEEFDATRIREEISFHIAAKNELLMILPREICIGAFKVNVGGLISSLTNKREELVNQLLDMLTQQLRSQLDDILFKYVELELKLSEIKPETMEESSKLREFIKIIPVELKNLIGLAKELQLKYKILDFFHSNIPDEDFQLKWQVFAYPKKIEAQVEETEKKLIKREEELKKSTADEEKLIEH